MDGALSFGTKTCQCCENVAPAFGLVHKEAATLKKGGGTLNKERFLLTVVIVV